MSVNFNGVKNNPVSPQRPDTPSKPAITADKGPATAPKANEGVNLSARAKAVKVAEQQLREQPEIDDAKVAQIRQALESGTYKIDAEQLAQKMLDMDQSIFG